MTAEATSIDDFPSNELIEPDPTVPFLRPWVGRSVQNLVVELPL